MGGREKGETEPAVSGEVQAGLREGERTVWREVEVICGWTSDEEMRENEKKRRTYL